VASVAAVDPTGSLGADLGGASRLDPVIGGAYHAK